MSVISVGSRSSQTVQSLVEMRAQLDDLTRQLSTGKKSDTYAGLGIDRGFTVTLNARLSAIGGYTDTVKTITPRLTLAQTTLTRLSAIGSEVKTAVSSNGFDPDSLGQTSTQKAATTALGEYLSLLNTQVGDRYMFSGMATDKPSVGTIDQLLDGSGAKAGLKQVIDERRQADLGASGLGRVVMSSPSASAVAVTEDAATSPFGFKLSALTSTIAGATVSGPTGSPKAVSIDLGTSNAVAGNTVNVTYTLPDGTSETVKLTATTDSPAAADQFTIGATPDDTAANIKAALTAATGQLARTSLTAASAIAASNDFFNIDDAHPPQRVNGPPFDSATGLRAGSDADTVTWYTGEAGSGSARASATASIDQSISVAYGMRANEQGVRWLVQNIAVAAATTYSAGGADASKRASALQQRLTANLGVPSGVQSIQNIQTELGGVQASVKAASDRHTQTASLFNGLLDDTTGASKEEVGAKILAMQTSLQASLQTTAMLSKLSLVNFM